MNIEQIVSSLQPSKIGETANKYIIPNGQYGNNSGSNVEIIIPKNYNTSSSVYGHIDGGGKMTWNQNESAYLNNNNNNGIIVKLIRTDVSKSSVDAMMNCGNRNMQILDYVSNITGINSASLAGASDGTMYALATAAASTDGNHSMKITTATSLDYGNLNNFDPTPYFNKMLKNNISFEVISGGIQDKMGGGKMMATYADMGGNTTAWLWNGGLEHDYACSVGARQAFGIAVNHDITRKVAYDTTSKKLTFTAINPTKYLNPTNPTNLLYKNTDKKQLILLSNKENIQNDLVTNGKTKIITDDVDNYSNRINTTIENFKNHPKTGDKTYNSEIINHLNMSFSNISKNRELVLGDAKFFSTLLQSTKQSYLELDNNLANNANKIFESSEIISKIDNINFSISNRLIINNARYSSNINTFNYFNESNGKISYNIKDVQSYMSSSNPIMNALYNDLNDYNVINTELQSFINGSNNNLIGPEWDLLRETAKLIVEEVNLEIENIKNEINQRILVLTQIKEYLEKYDSLDESKIEEVKQEIARIEEEIRKLEEAKRQQEMAKYEKA